MERSLRPIDPLVHITEGATLEGLGQTVARARIEAVLTGLGVVEQRARKWTMVLTGLVCIAMNLVTEEAIDDVLGKLMQGPRFLRPDDDLAVARASAICQGRQQLGVKPLVALVREVCQPLATAAPRDAFLLGLRLMAIDGVTEDVPDTPTNARYFGRQHGSRGESAFPQVRAVYLCECGTHAMCEAGFWPYATSERVGDLRLLRSVGPGRLVMGDRGFHSFDMALRWVQRQAHFLGRVPAHGPLTPSRRLSDGSSLAELRPSEYHRRKRDEHLVVRLIEYPLEDPGRVGHGERHRRLTSLLDEVASPAHTVAVAYHERGEIEITIDETDPHQRRAQQPLRSRPPLGVLQELYGLLLAHYAIRSLMHPAAVQADVPPDRFSFVNPVRLLRRAVFEGQIIAPAQLAEWHHRLMRDIGREQLPERDHRCNPRLVKRKMSNFKWKREAHRHWTQPTKSFAEAVVVLI